VEFISKYVSTYTTNYLYNLINILSTSNMMLLNQVTPHKLIPANLHGRDFFVGDIHGQKTFLYQQLKTLNFDFLVDRIFCAGDIIDRGEESQACIDLLMQPWFFSTLGNHEAMFLQGFEQPKHWQTLIKNGGQWLESLMHEPQLLLRLAQLIRIKMTLSLTVENALGKIGVIHADAPADWQTLENLAVNEESVIPLIWYRRNLITPSGTAINNIDAVVHGHNSLEKPVVINNQLWIDTLQKKGSLTIMQNREIFSLIKGDC
jgi:serine/threonine protein phosphatase 1